MQLLEETKKDSVERNRNESRVPTGQTRHCALMPGVVKWAELLTLIRDNPGIYTYALADRYSLDVFLLLFFTRTMKVTRSTSLHL